MGIPLEKVVGTWRLVASRARDDEGGELPPPYGADKMGVLVLGGNGRMIAVLCDSRAAMPAGEQREYCGAYTFDGATLVTRVDANSDAARFTADQVRAIRFEGERLVLTPPPRPYKGTHMHRELFWERIA